MALAVYGKHPAKGDFLEHGVPGALRPLLEGWLDQVLAQARADLGGDWERVWATAPMLRFWLGEGIWGEQVCGVMVATQDRVGRRFPLVLMALGAAVPPPVVDADQGWYDGIAAHLARMLRLADIPGPAALLTGAPLPAPLDQPGPTAFWAMRPGHGVGDLLADIAMTDHRRAAAGRSYWWVAGEAVPDPASEAGDFDGADFANPETGYVGAGTQGDSGSTEPAPDAVSRPEDKALLEAETPHDADPPTTEPLPESEPAPTPQPDPDPSHWDVAQEAAFDDSPFAATAGPSLFAAPLPPATNLPPRDSVPVSSQQAQQAHQARGALWSQVWAGDGLPPGPVVAWFLRGHDGDD